MLTQELCPNPLHPDFLGHLTSPWLVCTKIPLAPGKKSISLPSSPLPAPTH